LFRPRLPRHIGAPLRASAGWVLEGGHPGFRVSFRDRHGPTPREGDSLGQAATVDELHALLRDRVGEFRIAGTVTVYIDLQRPVDDDRRFLERIALAANGQRAPW
jgi:hypothetical protein